MSSSRDVVKALPLLSRPSQLRDQACHTAFPIWRNEDFPAFVKELPQSKSTSLNQEESNCPFCFQILGSWSLSGAHCVPQPPRLCGTSPRPSWVADVGSQGAPEEAWPLPQCCLRFTKKSKSIASGKYPLLVHGRHISGDSGLRTTLITAETADSRSNDT